jgi:Leucine-rich repeat (LRR) protein
MNHRKGLGHWLNATTMIVALSLLGFWQSASAAIPASERAALIDLYNSTGGAGWTNGTNWNGAAGTECTWYGVTCDAGGTTVEGLSFDGNHMSGTLPSTLPDLTNLNALTLSRNYDQLTGPIPATWGTFAHLIHVDLMFNGLSGPIPPELGNLSTLVALQLSYNPLAGSIPPELGNLSNLQVLRLDSTSLTGSIPTELGNLVQLGFLALGDSVSGSRPVSLSNLAQLTQLYLSGTFSGAIPAQYGSLTNLQYLGIGQIAGPIPPELGNLSNLRMLSLSGQMSGSIPTELGNLANLQMLWLSPGQLTGSIPAVLGNLTQLTRLGLANNQLSGAIPTQLGNLVNMNWLELSQNQLSGSIPSSLGNLTVMQSLGLSTNLLTGSIPVSLGSLSNLQNLYLDSNQLTGSIPPELGNLASLQELWLGANQLTGTVPTQLGNLSNLRRLVVAENQLSGALPAFAGMPNVHTLDLATNHFTGAFPMQFAALPNLQALYISRNQFSGPLPAAIDTFTKLVVLRMEGNNFVGTVPVSITNMTILQASGVDFRFNGLYSTDPAVVAFITARQADWQNSQTVPVSGLAPGAATSNSIALSWTPIIFTGESGGYQVFRATAPGGPYTLSGTTADKLATGIVVTGLAPATTYYFVVRSVTSANPNNQNIVVSDPSAEVSAATTGGAAPSISTASPLPAGTVGTAYSQPFTATGGTSPYGNWQVIAGAMPPGLTLGAATGVLSGTPTTAVGSPFTFTVQVTDAASVTATKPFSLTINAAPIFINTASQLPAGAVGTAYSQTFSATGGTPPYVNWQVIAGALPPGLTLGAATGVLSGTPTTAAGIPFAFTVQVTDAASVTATKPFSLAISAAGVATTQIPLLGPFGLALLAALLGAGGAVATRSRMQR